MKKIYLIGAAAIALAACDKNYDNPDFSNGAAIITATIGESTLTRAVDDSWNPNDRIGISSTIGGEPGPYINVEYTTEAGDGKFEGEDLFFYKPMTLTAYYPYSGSKDNAPGIISAETSAEFQTDDKQPKIDFLWDTKTGVDQKDFSAANPNVNFTFAHKMSKISFTFQSSDPMYDPNNPTHMVSDGVDVATMISYSIEGLGVKGTFDTASGVCALDESEGRQGIEIKFSKVETDEKMKERTFPSLIVFPQKKPSDGFILHITTDELNKQGYNQTYKCALRFTDDELKPGCHYIFTIKVTKVGLIVGNLTIAPWSEEEKFIIATIDGEPEFND